MILGAHDDATPDVRAAVLQKIVGLGASLSDRRDDDALTEAHLRQAERDIALYLVDPDAVTPTSAAPAWGRRPRSPSFETRSCHRKSRERRVRGR